MKPGYGTLSTKRRIALVGALLAVLGVVVVLAGLGAVTRRTATGADKIVVSDDLPTTVREGDWFEDPWDGRAPDPASRKDLAATYERAWNEVSLGVAGTAVGTDPTFLGQALDMVRTLRPALGSVSASDHRLELRFFADDGAVAAVRATTVVRVEPGLHPALEASVDLDGTGAVAPLITREVYDLVMTREEDATWRIRSWRRVAREPISASSP